MNRYIRFSSLAIAVFILCVPSISFAVEEGAADARRGEATFKLICSHCHRTDYDESRVKAPGLRGVLERHDVAWLNQWLKSPAAFAKKDETAKTLIDSHPYKLVMPTLPEMQDAQNRADVIEYLKTLKDEE
ncbi:MAG: c-type cytochrome [Mariprofundaceae bacterium]